MAGDHLGEVAAENTPRVGRSRTASLNGFKRIEETGFNINVENVPRINNTQTTAKLERCPSAPSSERQLEENPARLYPRQDGASLTGADDSHSAPELVTNEHLDAIKPRQDNSLTRVKPNIEPQVTRVPKPSLPPEGTASPNREWIPFMLRKPIAFTFAAVLFLLIGLLAFLDHLSRKRQGFSTANRAFVIITQFVPTVLVVLLSFAWQKLVTDVKIITPWAAMTNRWTNIEGCIHANYIDDLEVKSVFKSFRRKHWGVLIALLGGFLCGSLVPFAAGLFVLDPLSDYTSNTTLIRTSRFEFNGSLKAFDPATPNVEQPIAALVGNSRFDSLLPSWTSKEYAFESFNISSGVPHGTLSKSSVAFSGNLDCRVINYDARVTRPWYTLEYAYKDSTVPSAGLKTDIELVPNGQDMIELGCHIEPSHYPKVIFSRPMNQSVHVLPAAWLNVTSCSGTDNMPISITMMDLLSDDVNHTTAVFKATGLLCTPQFSTKTVELVVNASTASLINITQVSNDSILVDIGVNSTRLMAAINRGNQEVFFMKDGYDIIDYASLTATWDNLWVQYQDIAGGSFDGQNRHGYIGIDTWFVMLSLGNVSKIQTYSSDMSALATDSSRLFRSVLAQIANFGFRVSDASPASGAITSTFGFLGIVAICCATTFRPRACLTESPASLAAMSVILAASEEFEEETRGTGQSSDRAFRNAFRCIMVRLVINENMRPSMQINGCSDGKYVQKIFPHKERYIPLLLRKVSRTCLIGTITGVILAVGIVLRFSMLSSGFDAENMLTSLAWSYVPNAILVLLGYAIQGTVTCAQAWASYAMLRRGSAIGQKSMLSNPAEYSAFSIFRRTFWKASDWALAATYLVAVIIAVVKIIAAGLYTHLLFQHSISATVGIDQTLVTNLDQLSTGSSEQIAYGNMADAFAAWTHNQDMHFPSPSGAEGSLVFSNLTSRPLTSEVGRALGRGGALSVTIPAIQVEVNCSAYGNDDFQVVREGSIIRIMCKSQTCRRYFPAMNSSFANTYGQPQTPAVTGWQNGFKLSSDAMSERYTGWVGGFLQGFTDPEDFNHAPISGVFMKVIDYGPNGTSSVPRINLTVAAIAGYSCTRLLRKVNAKVFFTRKVETDFEGKSMLPAGISSFDAQSVLPAEDLPPYDTKNVSMNFPHTCVSASNNTCGSSTSWITPTWSDGGASSMEELTETIRETDFTNVLAAASEVLKQSSNAPFGENLLDPRQLPSIAKEAYIVFTTQFINALRPLARKVRDDEVQRTATVTQQSNRVVQSRDITIALIVLLALILGCVVLILWRTDTKPITAKAPNSIAAQASLLAGSNLVRRLKEDDVSFVAATNLWNEEVFSMGWWAPDEPQTTEEVREARWGIDIGVARLRNNLEK